MNKLYSKIEKLLKMGEGKANENESNVALEMAYRIMRENNISKEMIDSFSREEELGKLGEWQGKEKLYKEWEKSIALSMSKLFDCCLLLGRKERKSYFNFIGREGNVRSAMIMNDWLRDKVWKDSKGRASRYSYCMGVANSIHDKVCEMKRGSEGEGYGLIIVNEAEEYKKKMHPSIVVKNIGGRVSNGESYRVGKEDGKSINLNKQFGLKGIE